MAEMEDEYTILEEIPVTPLVFPNNTSDQGKLPFELDISEVIRNNFVFKVHSLVYTCRTCDRKFNNTGNFEKHLQSHKTQEKTHVCDICNKEFKSVPKLEKHKESDHVVPCKDCRQSFRNAAQLANHRRTSHKEDRPFQCDQCGKGMKTSWMLKQHLLTHQAAAHRCEFCSKAYKRKDDLLKHYETH